MTSKEDKEKAMFENIRRPDFFIVGAPKSGTTAMYDFLRQHPQVFMTRLKDISFFGQDLQFRRPRLSSERYLSLFSETNGALRAGEASVWYLYSKLAAEEIKSFSPSASIIAMLRNPVDMLYAQHSEFLHNCNEEIEDFEAALDAEEDRKQGKRLPKKVHLVEGLFYRETAKYAEQIRRYMDIFGRENVHVIIFDDFKQDTNKVYRQALKFLGVDPNFRPKIRRVNSNKVLRNRWVQEFLVAPPLLLKYVFDAVIPAQYSGRFLPYLVRLNTRYVERPPLDPALRKRLQMELKPEVKQLGELLNRDLSHWYEV
jgi:hypothetical protein